MGGNEEELPMVSLWDPVQGLPKVASAQLAYSHGFLNCQLPQWFPGLSMQWLTLAHSLGMEVKIASVSQKLSAPSNIQQCYVGKIGSEEIAVSATVESFSAIANSLIPGAKKAAQQIVLEYLARRFLTSVVLSWSGPHNADFSFIGVKNIQELKVEGVVNIKLSMNGVSCTVVVLLGKKIVEHLDGLWRRQIRSLTRQGNSTGEISVELAQLAVRPSAIADYTRSGTMIDLEVPVSDSVMLRLPDGGVVPAKLRICEQEFVIETQAGANQNLSLPEGTTRLSVQLGTLKIDSTFQFAETMQPNAMTRTGIPVSNSVKLIVNSERIGIAKVCSYEGRFAISVE